MSVPELRPLGVGELLDVALKIWRRHFGALAKVVLFVVTPFELLATLLLTAVAPTADFLVSPEATDTTSVDGPVSGEELAAFFVGIVLAGLISGFAFLVSSAASLQAVSIAYLGGSPDWRASLRMALGRLGSLVWLAVVMSVGLGIAFTALIVPGVWLAVAWSTAFVALLAEGTGGTKALGRSFRLVRGRWWPTFGTLVLAFILQTIVRQIVSFPFSVGLLAADAGSALEFASIAVSSIVSAVITTPFMAAVFVLVYFDLRVRKEGFDLALLARTMGPRGGEGFTGTVPPPSFPGPGAPPSASPGRPPPDPGYRPPGSVP